ncbi:MULTISPECIES: sulfite exporter TauE/SafE family protein [Halomonadaceae]|uniref:sulfite exporter TauE/SafE family protein n=1 Tax=Halomonadaceae TaxID=28256 RepID=UPI0015831D4C|nr:MULTISPECIES: sulfite exporter TauE/SafE family protein [Halomonas]MDI4637172.1 sulfite exporter TauE/SafE family protein [Halomonas sp. BMC7]NUJ58340.1 sulfite exporter TauE/SafE family protein [Halomonas taeanensis]
MILDISAIQLIGVAATAFLASLIGGISGYGTGLLLPPILIPMIGPEAVVPVVSLSALITNASRVAAFRHQFDRARALWVVAFALPFCLLGAYGYTRLSGPMISVVLGLFLIAIVPLRPLLVRRHGHLGKPGLALGAGGYGLLMGGTSGSGVVLISLLLSAGLSGASVIATDAGISLLLGIAKVSLFQAAGALPPALWLMALLIGACAVPGTFLAKRLSRRLSLRWHSLILDGVVVLGGLLLVIEGASALL